MKRAAVIGSIVMAVAVIVGAFIIGGGNGSTTEAKSGTTTVSPAKAGAEAINSGKNDSKSQSGGPTTSEKQDDEGGDDKGKECKPPAKNKYETKSQFLGLDPATVRSDKKVEFQVKNFRPCVSVTLSYKVGDVTTVVVSVQTDKNGKAEGKFAAPPLGGKSSATFSITASDGALDATTTLTVVKKK